MTDLDDRITAAISKRLDVLAERTSVLEEKVEVCAAILDLLMKAMGLVDEDGEWTDPRGEVDFDETSPGPPES